MSQEQMAASGAPPATDSIQRRHPGEVGLALSGGGFRAALFALGVVWRLNECGWLKKLTHITSVSGGSITSAYLGMRWTELMFDSEGVAKNFEDLVAKPIEKFCTLHIDVPCALKGLLTPFRTIGDYVARKYQRELYHHLDGSPATLQDLPSDSEGPMFIIYATNLQTGSSVRFARPYIWDWRLGQLQSPKTSLAVAVGASSAFPPFLSPVQLKTSPKSWSSGGTLTTAKRESLRRKLVLSDGGVYDNLGLEAIFERCGTILVSDAGAPAEIDEAPSTNWFGQLARVRAVMMEQTRALRRRMVMSDLTEPEGSPRGCKGALWRIGTNINAFRLNDAMTIDSPVTAALQHIRTRLNPFSPREQGELINWGYALCDAGIRKHVDTAVKRGKWPRPAFAFGEAEARPEPGEVTGGAAGL